jgi:UDP-glucose 4-epimerase
MRVLIAGGFGFIGGRLAQHLAQAGHHVMLGSRVPRPLPDWLPTADVGLLDWRSVDAMAQLCCGFDVVIQAAGMNAQRSVADPVAALEFNGLATARLLDAATKSSVKRFIYLSTAHVYTSPLVGIVSEANSTLNPHPYATSHVAGENAVLTARSQQKIEGIVLRLSNAFGAPTHREVNCWMLLVNDLCRQAVMTGTMTLTSSGSQLRDFIPIGRVCRIAESVSNFAVLAQIPDILNVGSGVSQSVLEMAKLIQSRCLQTLGFEPSLRWPKSTDEPTTDKLFYKTERMQKLEMQYKVDPRVDVLLEIDRLLLFCGIFKQENQRSAF